MVNTILIGKVIYKLLSQNEELESLVGNKIYPLVAENSATYPFVVFYRNGISNNPNKDGYGEDNVNYTIVVVSNKYSESIEIANKIRQTIEFKRYVTDDMEIYDSHMINIDESFYEEAYIQTMTFNAKIY